MGKDNKRKTTQEFKDEVFSLTGDEFSVLTEYKNTKTHIRFRHNTCGNEFDMSPDHFLRGYRCPKCSYKRLGASRKIKNSEVKSFIESVDGYTLESEYISSNSKVKIKHHKCGHTFEMKFRYFRDGQRCPKCRLSKGEEKIRLWLEGNNFKFQQQYRFKECKDLRPLPFDFKVDITPDNYILIEYDGSQHFGDSRLYDGNEKHDKIKDDFCKSNNIQLLRIPYTDFTKIDTILENYLSSTTIRKE